MTISDEQLNLAMCEMVRDMAKAIAEWESTAWDGCPKRRSMDVGCMKACRLIVRANALLGQANDQAVPCSALDAPELGVIRGIITALAEFTCATPELIVRALTGVLFTAGEAQHILWPNSSDICPGKD